MQVRGSRGQGLWRSEVMEQRRKEWKEEQGDVNAESISSEIPLKRGCKNKGTFWYTKVVSMSCQQTALEGKLQHVLWASGKSRQINTGMHRRKWRAVKLTHVGQHRSHLLSSIHCLSRQTAYSKWWPKVMIVTWGFETWKEKTQQLHKGWSQEMTLHPFSKASHVGSMRSDMKGRGIA